MAQYSDLALYRRLLHQARPYWFHIVVIFLLGLLSVPLALLNPIPLKVAVDSVVGSEPLPSFLDVLIPATVQQSKMSLLIVTASLVVIINLLSQCVEQGNYLLSTYTGEKLVLDLRAKLFRQVQRLSLAYHDSKGTSDATYRIQWDSTSIQNIALYGILPLMTAIIKLFSMIYVMVRINLLLAMVALVVSPFLFLIAGAYRRSFRRGWSQVKKLQSDAFSVIQEVLTALRVVKAFGQEEREQKRFFDHSQEGIQARIRLSFAEGSLGLLLNLTTSIGTGVVLFIGVSQILSGKLTLGNLLLVMAYLSQLYAPLNMIGKKIANIQSQLASVERVYLLLDQSPDVIESPHPRPLMRAKGAIAFRNVSFAYDSQHQILQNISFDVPAGARVGIAGKTGAGKTTLVNLLTRFYDPIEGQILLDGFDLRDYKLTDLRNQFAIVLQEPVLFSASIAENIAYAYPHASEKEIIQAAKAANAHDFIVDLPNGYDTQVGERGMRLSGGQRQRIALARAFLKDAPILIMDEPTSSVDMATETKIMDAMERLMHGRTTFTIAHRLSTLESCDLLLVLEAGKLVAAQSDVSAIIQQSLVKGELDLAI